MYLDILAWIEAANLIEVHDSSKGGKSGSFVLDSLVPGFDVVKAFSQKIAVIFTF